MLPQKLFGNNVIFPDYKLCYIAIPKAANSSIKQMLLPLIGIHVDRPIGNVHNKNSFPFQYLAKHSLYRAREDYLIFTVVRNPWDRLVSHYNDKVCRNELHEPLKRFGLFYSHMPFEEYVEAVSSIEDKYADVHFMSQAYMIIHAGHMLPHLVFRMETLDRDWETISTIISRYTGVPIHYVLKKANQQPHKPYQEYYTDKTRALVLQRYGRDVKRLGYTF